MLIRADARALPLVDGCVDCVVTSPPYWGLRDYGNSGQIGLESTPDAYVSALVSVFREVWRVLADDGTVWLNLGDSYNSAFGEGQGPSRRGSDTRKQTAGRLRGLLQDLKPKDLVGIPWRVAFALQADGWYLRSDIIWSKPNPMPESVTDRPTKAHEYIFLLSKSAHYYYDAAVIAEAVVYADEVRVATPKNINGLHLRPTREYGHSNGRGTRNKRSVWQVTTEPYPNAHFATFPEALITPCILAGCPAGGVVLDPFIGSGTTGAVAERLGRRWVGTDLTYQHLAKDRTAQRGFIWTAEGDTHNGGYEPLPTK